MELQEPPVTSLSFRERMRLAWEMVWPLFLVDLGFAILIHGVLQRERDDMDSIYVVLSLLVIAPWVIRRALRLSYPAFRIRVLKDGEESALGYQDSLKVVWLMVWRSTVLGLALLLPLSLAFSALGWRPELVTPSRFTNALGLSVFDAVTGVVLFPWLVPGMLRKRYAGFRLEAERVKTFSHLPVKKELVRGRRRPA